LVFQLKECGICSEPLDRRPFHFYHSYIHEAFQGHNSVILSMRPLRAYRKTMFYFKHLLFLR
jgi:hypothetical protein